jgi:eukaryotic-like serine/threonine-protein kinase
MALAPGTRLGPYEITAQIGVGGMGEVWCATDTHLGRQVAIKIIPDAFAHHPERLARFEREAKTLASLNHPNIAQIYGLEKTDSIRALVMELVEGPTLADRIAQGPIPFDEALPIVKQIAEALQAAHEQGIIHRDLKPANVKVRPDGTVKVLDFGLAKTIASEAQTDLANSPTVTAMATRAGVLLGTAAYMSPEQTRGKTVDKRTDIWAFGCVLYEMLTGTRAFDAEDVSQALAAVLRDEPDWTALPADLSLSMRTLIKRCLDKDPTRRVRDIAIARYVLDEPAVVALSASDGVPALPISGGSRTSAKRRIAPHAAVALLASAVVGSAVWLVDRSFVLSPPVSRFVISLQGATALTVNGVDRGLAITPDGSRIIYVGNNGTQLFGRPLDASEPVAIYKADYLRGPFVSPDGQWVGFIQSNSTLQKVATSGGPAIMLARLDGVPRGATWAADHTIVFATTDPTTGLLRIPDGGGAPMVLTRPDGAQGEVDHLWPEMLPGGRAVLFTITAPTARLDVAQVAVLNLESGTRKVLVRGGSHAHYVSSGHLVYAAAGSLMAVGFDATRLETRGTPVPVVIAHLMTTVAGAVDAVVAGNGTLAYASGASAVLNTLVWVDRQGRETAIAAPPRAYTYARIAPDGTRLALYSPDQDNDIWLWDFARPGLTRTQTAPGNDVYPVWTPDGQRLIFASERAGRRNLFSQAADGPGIVEQLTDSPNAQNPTAITPDGTRLLFTETAPKTGEDVMQLQLDGTHRVRPLVQTPFTERNGIVSPDGRWLAYEANDSGQLEIYVRPFPAVNGGTWRVSTDGGMSPVWAGGGQELFYVAGSGALMRVSVERSPTWVSTVPAKLIEEGYVMGGVRNYDISPDGQRFLMIKPSPGSDQATVPRGIVVVQNWTEELKRLVPTK